MTSANYSNPDSLGELSMLMERTLLDTGRLFRKNGSIPSSTHLQRSIPSYYESFQSALDNLSEQIFIAKAFLEKDYEAIKARETAPQLTEDVAMNDADLNIPPQVQPPPPSQPIAKSPSPEKVDLKEEEPTVTEPQVAPTATIPEPPPKEEVTVKVENEQGASAPTDQGLAETQEINFDSVLNDTGGANTFDLNLDFGNDDTGNQAFLSGTTFGNAEKPNVSMPAENPMENTTPHARWRGTDGDTNLFPEQGAGTDDIMGPGESSFDDLFMETENFGEGGDLNQLEGDSLMNISELDDNWFS
ncbi:hypothetical protein N7509_007115 [Penicillium cosmopolitanum]|uniref:Uncharacterized protein n=1 Tax=Penicillium cosmopolitanum TaxID=1131564 RepID=A0A9X0B811_9EURO|nr:uncharacterized protein N7509_007115 [Penicillium cosmopolitanum]KAJ5391625.1 hypothetical protein N7509_007115 [Penicillium cosmopolitanum]